MSFCFWCSVKYFLMEFYSQAVSHECRGCIDCQIFGDVTRRWFVRLLWRIKTNLVALIRITDNLVLSVERYNDVKGQGYRARLPRVVQSFACFARKIAELCAINP